MQKKTNSEPFNPSADDLFPRQKWEKQRAGNILFELRQSTIKTHGKVLTIKELHDAIGVNNISNLERSDKMPSRKILTAYSSYFHVSVEDLEKAFREPHTLSSLSATNTDDITYGLQPSTFEKLLTIQLLFENGKRQLSEAENELSAKQKDFSSKYPSEESKQSSDSFIEDNKALLRLESKRKALQNNLNQITLFQSTIDRLVALVDISPDINLATTSLENTLAFSVFNNFNRVLFQDLTIDSAYTADTSVGSVVMERPTDRIILSSVPDNALPSYITVEELEKAMVYAFAESLFHQRTALKEQIYEKRQSSTDLHTFQKKLFTEIGIKHLYPPTATQKQISEIQKTYEKKFGKGFLNRLKEEGKA